MQTENPPVPGSDARPHVVILGAGASRASCPKGDRNGRKLPVIADFIETLGLEPKLKQEGVFVPDEDFEALYSRLVSRGQHPVLVQWLEDEVFNYFGTLKLPDRPTVYDHLVLSLRPKDVIASFNWDPFLIQALNRCSKIANPPLCLHLHGNVAMGYCIEHQPATIGRRGATCQQCGKRLIGCRLLYPVAKKDYISDPIIAKQWQQVHEHLRACFLLTLFGYGAPATDVEAVNLIKQGWGDSSERSLEQTEIIDIRPEEDLHSRWKPLIHSHHYETHTTFYESTLGKLARRSVEEMQRQIIDAEFIQSFPIPKDADWPELRAWLQPYLAQENGS